MPPLQVLVGQEVAVVPESEQRRVPEVLRAEGDQGPGRRRVVRLPVDTHGDGGIPDFLLEGGVGFPDASSCEEEDPGEEEGGKGMFDHSVQVVCGELVSPVRTIRHRPIRR